MLKKITHAINLRADLPMNLPKFLPLKPYLDAAIYDDSQEKNKVLFSAGLMLSYFDGVFEIYIPIRSSTAIKSEYAQRGEDDKLLSRISFKLALEKINGYDMEQRLKINF